MSRPHIPDAAERARLLAILSRSGDDSPVAASATLLGGVPGNVRPYLAHRLLERAEAPSGEGGAALRAVVRQAAIAGLRRQAELRAVLGAFAREGITSLVLKGPVLGPLVFPAAHLRPFRDLDLWVRDADMARARRTLDDMGLVFLDDEMGGRIDPRALLLARFPATGTLVEIHAPPASLAPLSAARRDIMWARARDLAVDGFTMRTLEPADLLVHVALHAARRDLFVSGVLPLIDLALLTERYGATWDWHALREEWRRDGIERPVLLALRLARGVLGAQPPEWLLDSGPLTERLRAMEPLAMTQLWRGLSSLFPPGVAPFVAPWPLRRRMRAVLTRVTTYYFASRPGTPSGVRERLREAARRLAHDLTVRVPGLLAAARRGELRPGVVRERARLWRDREHLAALLRADGGRSNSHEPAALPARPENAPVPTSATDVAGTSLRPRHDEHIAGTVDGAPT
jgi:hypothetical protein